MGELRAVWISFCEPMLTRRRDGVDLHVIAVGADKSLGEAGGFIVAGPVKRRLQHNLFRWFALRLVKECRRLGLAEEIPHAGGTDAIDGTKVRGRVVVKGAPANAARILRVGRKRVMDTHMTDRVFTQPLQAD